MASFKTPTAFPSMFEFNEYNIVFVEGLSELLESLSKRIKINYPSQSTLLNYRRAIRDICLYHGALPKEIEIDEIIDYLYHLRDKGVSWYKIKVDAASLRYFYRDVLHQYTIASYIPYPKEEKPIPHLLSRNDIALLYNATDNLRDKIILSLLYGSGLRRSEVINLRLEDIDTDDGKYRIRVNKGKGLKDRYTVLSTRLAKNLEDYYTQYNPINYLINGQPRGSKMSTSLIAHYLNKLRLKCGIVKKVNSRTIRHSFATHALEDGMPIIMLQKLLGHSSIFTTMIYLHVSEVNLKSAFSPLDNLIT